MTPASRIHSRMRLATWSYTVNSKSLQPTTTLARPTQSNLLPGQRKITTAKERVEWQANRFAASFLMPRETFRDAVVMIQEQLGVIKNVGIVYLDESAPNVRDFNQLIIVPYGNLHELAARASITRLADLRMLIDRRNKGVSHISQLFSEL